MLLKFTSITDLELILHAAYHLLGLFFCPKLIALPSTAELKTIKQCNLGADIFHQKLAPEPDFN